MTESPLRHQLMSKTNYQILSYSNLAPEILLQLDSENGIMVTYASDIWSVGCILFSLISNYEPFEEQSAIATLLRIFKTCGIPNFNEHDGLFNLCPNLL